MYERSEVGALALFIELRVCVFLLSTLFCVYVYMNSESDRDRLVAKGHYAPDFLFLITARRMSICFLHVPWASFGTAKIMYIYMFLSLTCACNYRCHTDTTHTHITRRRPLMGRTPSHKHRQVRLYRWEEARVLRVRRS